MKQLVFLVIFTTASFCAWAQLTTNEQPYGLQQRSAGKSKQSYIVLTPPDVRQLNIEDSINGGSTRFAYPVLGNYTPYNSGVWEQLPDGSKLWRLKVKVPDALSTHTYYNRFWLPDGAKFFVYSEETEQFIGAVTSEFIKGSKNDPIQFATALIYGESVVYEYYQPASVSDTADIVINRIDYGYRPFDEVGTPRDEACNFNVCDLADLVDERRAVTRIITPAGSGSECYTGSLMNNTNCDNSPYVLTSVRPLILTGLDAEGNTDANQWIFYWNYTNCPNNNILITIGASVLSNSNYNNPGMIDMDFALLHLTQNPRCCGNNFKPYYLGWDRSTVDPPGGSIGYCIYHPYYQEYAMVSNITTNSQPVNSSIINFPAGALFDTYATFNNVGAYGAPLFYDTLLKGVFVYADGRRCTSFSRGFIKFGHLYEGTYSSGTTMPPQRRLKDWLDPENKDSTKLKGMGKIEPNASGILFVTDGGQGDKTGSSWENAIDGFADALKYANSGWMDLAVLSEIWVAAGIYYPTTTTDRNISFVLPPHVLCYGGFPVNPKNNISFAHRNPTFILTTLSGNIGASNDNSDNTYSVVIAGNHTHLDGFIIERGNGLLGGGIRVTGLTNLKGLDIRDNYGSMGGGMALLNDDSLTIIDDIKFWNNTANYGGAIFCSSNGHPDPFYKLSNILMWKNRAENSGGGIFIDNVKLEIDRATFMCNKARLSGGAIYQDYTRPYSAYSTAFINVLLLSNNAENAVTLPGYGGALYVNSGSCNLIHATISNNSDGGSTVQGVTACSTASINIYNSILYYNYTDSSGLSGSGINYAYSLIEGLSDTTNGNLDGITYEPLFRRHLDPVSICNSYPPDVSPYQYNYRLDGSSPCIDAGDNQWMLSYNLIYDLEGMSRLSGPRVDMGAYEYQNQQKGKSGDGKEQKQADQGASNSQNAKDWNLFAYPNPAANGEQIQILLTNGSAHYDHPVQLKLYSTVGLLLFESACPTGACTVNIPTIPSGIYTIRLQTEEVAFYTKKLVIF